MHKDEFPPLVGPNPSTAEDSIGHCVPWADSPFKGTGWTCRAFSAIFYILKEQFVFFYKDKLVLTLSYRVSSGQSQVKI